MFYKTDHWMLWINLQSFVLMVFNVYLMILENGWNEYPLAICTTDSVAYIIYRAFIHNMYYLYVILYYIVSILVNGLVSIY